MSPTVRYPAGPITPAGACHLLRGDQPMMAYRSYNDAVVFNLVGPLAIFDRTIPESIRINELKGLIPPWQNIEQKGATDDGATYVTSLYDPMEVDMTVTARGRQGAPARKLIRDWIDSWDAKKPGELSWFTPEMGRWWAAVRWMRQPVDPIMGGNWNRQKFTWTAKAYDAFWRSYDCVDSFAVDYQDDFDDFNTATSNGLTGWTIAYSGSGGGYVYDNGSEACWQDDPDHPIFTGGRSAFCRRNGYTSDSDNQVVSMQIGTTPEWSWPDNAHNSLWARMNNTGTPGTDGIRMSFEEYGYVTLSYFIGGVETIIRRESLMISPAPGEVWSLVAGYPDNSRKYTVRRNGSEVFTAVEPGYVSLADADHRSAGLEFHAGAAILTQATPAAIRQWYIGDHVTATQSGFVTRINVGDQDYWDRITCYGPGTFGIGNGPGSTDMVSFGPLLRNQVAQIRTDPRKRAVVDLSSVPPTPQQLDSFQQALKDFIDFATGNNAPPLLQSIESLFGIQPPQGNLYSMLKGRFSNPVPAKEAGVPPQKYQLAVSITGGDASSRVVVAGTPLRRYPG